jgi:hypothetical protein
VHGEGGQATVEWVALVLAAALLLGAGAALAGGETGGGLGESVAERITRAASAPAAGAPAPGGLVQKRPISGRIRTTPDAAPRGEAAPRAPSAAPPSPRAAPPPSAAPPAPASGSRAVDAFPSLRGAADVAKHAWIVCLGYERWRHELEHPSAPSEALPVDVALDILNTCFNPHDYLLEEE